MKFLSDLPRWRSRESGVVEFFESSCCFVFKTGLMPPGVPRLEQRQATAIMLCCVGVILLLLILAPCQVVFSQKVSVFGTLHETVSLPCPVNCTSGVLVWSTVQKPDEVLARCKGSSCSSVKGFHLPAEQYLKGNSSLTLSEADDKLQRCYIAKCDSEKICEVVFALSPLQITRVINPGDTIDVHIPPADSVEVSFTGNASALQVCTMKGEKMQCSSDYKQRASRTITLQIKDGNWTDAGNYTVRDTLNEQITAIVNVQVREKSYAGCKQENILPVWWIVLIVVLIVVLSLIIAVLIVVIIYLVKRNQQLQREPAANGHPPQSNGTAGYTAGEEQVMLP